MDLLSDFAVGIISCAVFQWVRDNPTAIPDHLVKFKDWICSYETKAKIRHERNQLRSQNSHLKHQIYDLTTEVEYLRAYTPDWIESEKESDYIPF